MCFRVAALLLLSWVISSECVRVQRAENVTDYLNRRKEEMKVKITEAYVEGGNTDSVVTLSYDIKREKLWSERFTTEGARAVSMFNKMFVLDGNRVMSVDLEPASNKTGSSLRQVDLIQYERPVRFVKSIMWRSNLYLLICHDDVACHLYTGKNDSLLKHRHKIRHMGRPMDATFFTRADRLYLVVAYSSDPYPVASILYRWTGTYMDIIDEFSTVGAVAVTAFKYKKGIVIVFAQNEKRQPDVGSQIYEFGDSGIEMIQYLPTNGPTSVQHYYHNGGIFLLMVNERVVSSVYCWDGKEFFHYHNLTDIVAPRMVNIVQLNDDTLFFVSYENYVSLYKANDIKYSRLKLLKLAEGERLIDLGVWIDGKTTLTLLLITVDATDSLYRIEPWELRINKIYKNGGISEALEASEECLSKLHSRLKARMEAVESIARRTWPTLLSSEKNISGGALSGERRLPKLILGSVAIAKLDVSSTRKELLLASEITENAAGSVGIKSIVKSILELSRNTVRTDQDNVLIGDVIVRKNGTFEELHTNAIRTDYLNGDSAKLDDSVISATKNQTFSGSQQLRGNNITVHHLEIEQLCGIPRDYWLLDKKSNIFSKDNVVDVTDDSIIVRSDLSLRDVKLMNVEGISINDFLNDIFIRGERQLIKGNIIKKSGGTLSSNDLRIEKLNGVSKEDFITKGKNQRFENDVFVKTMSIENLHVGKVNGIAVADSAMTSKKNHIKGTVSLATMRISDELAIDASKFPKVRPVQTYEKVTLAGRVTAANLTLGARTRFSLSGPNGPAIGDASGILSGEQSHWTKSTNQIVSNPITFHAGLSVDELTVNYLNGLDINKDVMMTSMEEISQEVGTLEFKNFVAKGSILEDETGGAPDGSGKLYDLLENALYINREFRIDFLAAVNLSIESYNGIPLAYITHRYKVGDSSPYEYSDEVQRFDSVTVTERLETEFLDARLVNGTSRALDSLLRRDASYEIDYLESDELTIGGEVKLAAPIANRIEEFMNSVSDSVADSNNGRLALTVDGELLIDGDLRAESINGESTGSYLYTLGTRNMTVDQPDQLIIEQLTVRRDFEFNLLQSLSIESLLEKTFSKSRPQNLSGSTFSFFKVSVENLHADWINKRFARDLIHTDSYDLELAGNVVFTNLTVSLDEDIQTGYLNGLKVDELYDKLATITPRVINNLTVSGDIFWERGRSSSAINDAKLGPLESIMKNAVVRSSVTDPSQEINGEIRIDGPSESIPGVFARRVRYGSDYSEPTNSSRVNRRLNGVDLGGIVDRSVLDDPNLEKEIHIVSETSFVEDLTTSRMRVSGGIGIDALNEWAVKDLKSSIVGIKSLSSMEKIPAKSRASSGRPFRQDNNNGGKTMIFSGDVHARKLIIRSNEASSTGPEIHGVPIAAIVLSSSNSSNNSLPDGTYFEHLQVYGDVLVHSLDSVALDDFVSDRVSLSMDHVVRGNIRFHGRVQVSDAASVDAINGIVPSDLVINYSHRDQIITGEKIFHGHITTYGKTHAPRIAGINFTDEYHNAVLNYESADIIGDIIFQSDIETSVRYSNSTLTRWQLSSESLVNEMPLKDLIKNRVSDEDIFLRALKRNETILEDRVARASNATSHLPEVFFYFEAEENLRINVAGVDRMEALRIGELTILDMYASQLGRYCGLPDECPCREQYVAEIRSSECQSRRVEAGRGIVYNFHSSDGAFGVSVATGSVSSSKRCTAPDPSSQFTTISWMKNIPTASSSEHFGSNVTQHKLEIHGYLSDVQVFTQNDLVFIALAIYYDPIDQSHQTDSLIYALDRASDAVTLVKSIPTSHATRVRVFKLPNRGAHVLFSSLGPSQFGKPAESSLYRIARGTLKFELLRSFPNGGNRHARSVSQSNDEFLLLDDVATNSIDVYVYDRISDNFQHRQSIYLDSTAPITGLEVFYAGEFRHSQVYVVVTTEHDQFFVYEYMHLGGFQLIARKRVSGILAMIPFDVSSRRYMFVGAATNSTVLRIVQQGRY